MEDLKPYSIDDQNPVQTFTRWHKEALQKEQNADAFTLATASKNGRPSGRTLLFKGLYESGLSFYSNYLSSKAKDLEENPEAEMVFYWHVTGRQVRIRGSVKKMEREGSDRYFQSRNPESQMASASSTQSMPIENREAFIKKIEKLKEENPDGKLETPHFWGGYYLDPTEIEFFVYGQHRINDRFLFHKASDNNWSFNRLQP